MFKKLWLSLLSLCLGFCIIWISFANPALPWDVNIDPVQGLQPEENFNDLIDTVVDPIKNNIETNVPYAWVDWIVIFIIDLFKTYIFPLAIVIMILISIFMFIEIMTSDDEAKRNKGIDNFVWWVIGIIIFTSAEFIFNGLYGIITEIADPNNISPVSRNIYAERIYYDLAYPFIKLAMYLVMGALFVLLLVKVVGYVADPNDKSAEKAKNIIVSSAMGIIVILLAKTLVEAIYSSETKILENTSTVFVGWWLLDASSQSYQKIFTIVNYFLGLISFFVLCIIIYQAYLMLFSEKTDDSVAKMRKNLLYMFGWLLLIGLSYVIVNFVIINP